VIRLSPRFQKKPAEETLAVFGDMLNRLKKRYKQSEEMPATADFPRLSGTSRRGWMG
jgi:hypothetical protein